MIAVGTYELFSHPVVIKKAYSTWNFLRDFVVKGKAEEHVQSIISEIIIKYSEWIEECTQYAFLGLYTTRE